MKKINLIQSVVLAFLLAAFALSAQDYPAANFEPKLIYASEPAVADNAAEVAYYPKNSLKQVAVEPYYPAANFQPKVVYFNEAAASAVESSLPDPQNADQQTEADPKFPAANFQPKVIYYSDIATAAVTTVAGVTP